MDIIALEMVHSMMLGQENSPQGIIIKVICLKREISKMANLAQMVNNQQMVITTTNYNALMVGKPTNYNHE